MPQGRCALCHDITELLDSHYIPAAVYKVLLRSSPGHQPVMLSDGVAIETSKQIHDYLLCAVCEDRFNRNGEKWVIAQGWQADGSFRLRDTVRSHGHETIYLTSGFAGVEHEQLLYFAASVFWRGSQAWKGRAGKLALGPYEEMLRLYLHGIEDFPKDCSIAVGVNPDSSMGASVIAPYLKNRSNQCWQYHFSMMGLSFDLFLGRGMDPVRRQMCVGRSAAKPIFVADAVGVGLIDGFGRLYKNSRIVGKLANS